MIKKKEQPEIDDAARDKFLDDATYAVDALWEKVSGYPLTSDEMYELNDALTAFFNGRAR